MPLEAPVIKVYMQPCEPHRGEEGCEEADWRSYWASFSFAVP
jgi:hypothetical protein